MPKVSAGCPCQLGPPSWVTSVPVPRPAARAASKGRMGPACREAGRVASSCRGPSGSPVAGPDVVGCGAGSGPGLAWAIRLATGERLHSWAPAACMVVPPAFRRAESLAERTWTPRGAGPAAPAAGWVGRMAGWTIRQPRSSHALTVASAVGKDLRRPKASTLPSPTGVASAHGGVGRKGRQSVGVVWHARAGACRQCAFALTPKPV